MVRIVERTSATTQMSRCIENSATKAGMIAAPVPENMVLSKIQIAIQNGLDFGSTPHVGKPGIVAGVDEL